MICSTSGRSIIAKSFRVAKNHTLQFFCLSCQGESSKSDHCSLVHLGCFEADMCTILDFC